MAPSGKGFVVTWTRVKVAAGVNGAIRSAVLVHLVNIYAVRNGKVYAAITIRLAVGARGVHGVIASETYSATVTPEKICSYTIHRVWGNT